MRLCSPAARPRRRRTFEGVEYWSGGVGEEEREELRFLALQYSLKVVTARRRDQGYVAGVRLTVLRSGTIVLDAVMDGPWLVADLRPGRYLVQAELRRERVTRELVLAGSARRELVFVFNDLEE